MRSKLSGKLIAFAFSLAIVLSLLPISSAKAIEFSVMTYNVENLFDTLHDEGKEDFTYLPIDKKRASKEAMDYCRSQHVYVWRQECYNLDWNENVLEVKIQNISRVIKSYDGGSLPDILVVQEVENLRVLEDLNTRGGLDYPTVVLLEGDDSRGIDVGILSKFPVVGEPKIHFIDRARKIKTRGILEVRLRIEDQIVAVFANHWPSQNNKDEMRVIAAKKLMEILPKSRADVRIAAGDFNTAHNDKINAIKEILTKPKRGLYYVDTNPHLKNIPQPIGSHWYRGKWDYLDRIFIDSRSATVATMEFEVHVQDFMMHEKSYRYNGNTLTDIVPFRFNAEEMTGYADHLPIVVKFNVDL